MNGLKRAAKYLYGLTAISTIALASGCGGGGGGQVPADASPAPSVTAVTPLPDAKNVPINVKIFTVTFTHEMAPTTLTAAAFSLVCGGNSIPGIASGSYLASSRTASFTVAAASNLPIGTTCTATVNSSAKDVAGTPLANDFTWHFTTAAVADTAAPTVSKTINFNGATGVTTNTKVGVTFSKAMDPTTITPATFFLLQGAVSVPGTIAYTGVSALFAPASNLLPNTRYIVTVKGGINGVKDVSGNPMENDFVIGWTTGLSVDTTPPTVSQTINANGASNVPINTKIGAIFSKEMDPLTITATTFTLSNGTATIPGVASYSGISALFIPISNLVPNTRYTVTVKGGPTGAKDLAGNPLASDYVWSWTTGSGLNSVAPTVVGTSIADGATGVAFNSAIGVTFSESMNPLTITNATIILREASSSVAVFCEVSISGANAVCGGNRGEVDFGPAPLYSLSPNTNYTATIKGGVWGVEDLAGNYMSEDYVWSWTTGALQDTTQPTATGFTPADLAEGVAINSVINISFNEMMDPQTINTANFYLEGIVGTVTYDAINRIASFTPSSSLANNTTYTATVTPSVSDLAGNTLGASNIVWRFTTAAF